MGKSIKRLLLMALIALLVIGGIQVYKSLYGWKEHRTQEEAEVLLEKMRAVAKLVTVEGQFAEIYDFEDYWGIDWSFFRKKALVRVKAKVSVGYDLSNLKITALAGAGKVKIAQLPDPEILSIDHDIDYYDISEGTFNSFSEEDFNRINRTVKDKIREQALQSDLLLAAEGQANRLLEVLQLMVESSGWELEYETRKGLEIPAQKDSLLD